MVQIELIDLKIKTDLKGYKKVSGSEVATEDKRRKKARIARKHPMRARAMFEMVLPSNHDEADHKWEIDASCFGMHL